ncbi:MAG: winged helix DNA-binding protein [Acidobacteria bacterium]|nr:winged helix DNA-binding protein [Acidobacteriota bacterium]
MAAIIQTLGVSKQAAGRLIDLLVQKDYLIRELDPQDRRRFILALSERGGIAARAIYGALRLVDERLESQIGADALQQLRFNLQVIAELELDIV